MSDAGRAAITDAARSLLLAALGTGDVEIVETHVSFLAFGRDRVLKLKKPVRFEFCDLSTRERREAACHAEVELNRRFAPDVYLGVVDLRDARGDVVDHAVEMRRMPSERRLATLARAGHADASVCVTRLADLLAAFHAGAPTGGAIDAAASRDSVAALWEAGFDEVQPFVGPVLTERDATRVEHLVRRYLAGREPLFAARVAAGRARDGHGDLLTDDVYCLVDAPRVLDCLEFDDRLRYGDVLADAAFLAMDLEHVGRADLARTFLDRYRSQARDDWPVSLEHHYVAYRAHVRAKVSALRHAQGGPGADASRRAAGALLGQCRRHLETGRVRLVLVGGLPGTGKTTLARALARRAGWQVLRSDEVRKELAHAQHDTPAVAAIDRGLYAPAWTARTYETLVRRASRALALGETVVLDASWSDGEWRRRAAAAAEDAAADVVELECRASHAVAAERVARRLALGADASDATPEVAAVMALRFAPWPSARLVATDEPVDVDALLEALDHAP